MRTSLLNILLLSLIFSQCQNEVGINPDLLIPDSAELNKMIIHQIVAKDSIQFSSSDEAYVAETYYSHIILGRVDNLSEFVPLDTIIPTYINSNDRFLMKFTSSIRAPKFLVTGIFETRFYTNTKNFTSTQISIDLYKFPFESSNLYLDLSNVPNYPDNSNIAYIQGFEINQNKIYYHLSGGFGVYSYTLNQNESELLYGTPGGDWLSLYQNKLYIDVMHSSVCQLNLDTREEKYDFILNTDWDIHGMDFKDDTLFVLHKNQNTASPYYFSKYDIDGILISSDVFPYSGRRSISFFNEYIYMLYGNNIEKYNPVTGEIEIIFPDLDLSIESIQIIGYHFYYSNADKRIICYLNLSEFDQFK